MNRVIVHVERVVLRGVAPERRSFVLAQLHEAMQREFANRAAVVRLTADGRVPELRLTPASPRDGKGAA